MDKSRSARTLLAAASLLVVLTACAPAPQSSQPRAGEQRPAPPKGLTIGLQRGLLDFSPFVAASGSNSSQNISPMINDGMVYIDDGYARHPLKATEVPSIDRGSWKIFDDGRMETIWRLRSNIFWHDGTPQTAMDYKFGFEVAHDKELPRPITQAIAAQSGVSFPDPLTVVVSWSSPYVDAPITSPSLHPRHLLAETYEADKLIAFINHPYWTHEYVGDGRYKIASWELGGDMELIRNDQYYLGRPPFDRVLIRVIGDAQALVSNILAGAVDIVLPTGVSLDAAEEVRNRWQGAGNEVRADVAGRIIHFEVQFRPERAQPRFGFTERPVRQAFYQSINRVALNDFMTHGFGPLADSWYQPSEPRRAELLIPQYAYDSSVGSGLLAQAGWAKGPDGVLTNSRTGDLFKASIWANEAAGWDKLAHAVAEDWKALGAQTEVFPIPPIRTGDREFEQGYTGLFVTNVNEEQFVVNRYHSSVIPSEVTRFVGSNRGGYSNPQMDGILDRLVATLDPKARTPIERELVQLALGQLVMNPFYWETLPILKLKGVKDHKWKQSNATWFFYDWDKE